MKECATIGRTKPFEISKEALEILENYDWEGNFRQLHNFATRLAVECLDDSVISPEAVENILGKQVRYNFHLPQDLVTIAFDPKTVTLDSIYLQAAGNVIEHILTKNGGSLRSAARNLGVEHTTLSRIMKKFKSSTEVKIFPLTPQKFAVAA